MTRALIAAVTLVMSSGALWAAPSPPVDEVHGESKGQASGILERFPARDAATRDDLCVEILGLGPEAIGDICGQVLPPGQGDDSQARYAVGALAVCAARPGAWPGCGADAACARASLRGHRVADRQRRRG